MAPIERAEMGDVWPAVEPGQHNSEYGTARLEPSGPCEIRSFQQLTITYTVGKFGLDDTGAIRIAHRFVHDGGGLQTEDPTAPNYVTATASNGVPLMLYPEPYAYRPWLLALRITVTGGFMREGDTITVIFGDRSGGSPGFRMQTICESAFEFKVSVDACATGQFREIDNQLHFPVVPGPLHLWKVVAPTSCRPHEEFEVGLKAEDIWGNPTPAGVNKLHLETRLPVDGLPEMVRFSDGARALRIGGLSVSEPGIVRIRLLDETGHCLAESNPVVIGETNLCGYWGDLHGQSGETIGIGTIDEYLEFARDLAFLDVSGHQANDFQITDAFWDKINQTTARMNEDDQFIVFPGYEWSGNTPVGGDHNVFFREEGRQIRRSSHAMLTDRSDIGTDANTLAELFDALRDEDCILFAHVGGRPADVAYAHYPELRTAVEVHSNWGTFEWILTDSLALGHRIGVVANSDGHKGRPGASPPGATEFGAYGGLTCFLAPALTRDAIFESMRRRHHYATTGNRLHLDVRAEFASDAELFTRDPRYFDVTPIPVREVIMGDIVRTLERTVDLSISVAASSPIERIDIMNGAELVQTLRCYEAADLGERVRILWQGAEYRGRGRNTHWLGEISFSGAGILRMEPINHWNIERRLEVIDDNRIAFDAVTSGNFAGVDVMLDTIANSNVSIRTNHVSGEIWLGDMALEDRWLDAGGLERGVRIRRLPNLISIRELSTKISVACPTNAESALWLRVTTLDGHLAWSSPVYLIGE